MKQQAWYNPEREVMPYRKDWVRCPACGFRFSLKSYGEGLHRLRHQGCGQRISIKEQH